MHNLVSESNVLDWINESAQECRSSYPMLQQKLPVAIDIGANVGGFVLMHILILTRYMHLSHALPIMIFCYE